MTHRFLLVAEIICKTNTINFLLFFVCLLVRSCMTQSLNLLYFVAIFMIYSLFPADILSLCDFRLFWVYSATGNIFNILACMAFSIFKYLGAPFFTTSYIVLVLFCNDFHGLHLIIIRTLFLNNCAVVFASFYTLIWLLLSGISGGLLV